MNKEETLRQKKVGAQIQKDMSEILMGPAAHLTRGKVVSVTKVRMSPDLTMAKIYVSVFPFAASDETVAGLKKATTTLRHELGQRVRHQLRLVPEINFYVDDSIEYAEKIDKLIAL
ncbi:MAG: 30S ribosome-binding factor RbfA [Mucinivorans sp.]